LHRESAVEMFLRGMRATIIWLFPFVVSCIANPLSRCLIQRKIYHIHIPQSIKSFNISFVHVHIFFGGRWESELRMINCKFDRMIKRENLCSTECREFTNRMTHHDTHISLHFKCNFFLHKEKSNRQIKHKSNKTNNRFIIKDKCVCINRGKWVLSVKITSLRMWSKAIECVIKEGCAFAVNVISACRFHSNQ
jgi:hypothetical protein